MSIRCVTLLAGLTGAMLLAGCHAQSGAPSTADAGAPATAADIPVPAPGSAPLSHSADTPPTPAPGETAAEAADGATTAAPSQAPSRPVALAPDLVLRRWGTAIERRDWAAVRGLWGHHGADSGLSPRQFVARWDALRRPRFTVAAGSQEGAAGSLYYTAPVTIADGARTISGSLTIRRVNDVDGATPEQLRWHADATTRAPWTTLR